MHNDITVTVLDCTVTETEDVPPDGLRVNYRVVIEIEGGQRPACIPELIARHFR